MIISIERKFRLIKALNVRITRRFKTKQQCNIEELAIKWYTDDSITNEGILHILISIIVSDLLHDLDQFGSGS